VINCGQLASRGFKKTLAALPAQFYVVFGFQASKLRIFSYPACPELRLHLVFIEAALSTKSPCSSIGWVIAGCDLSVTVFQAKAV
jgi:hypothetical protein